VPLSEGHVIPRDQRIVRGSVVCNEQGLLYIALSRHRRESDNTANAWRGLGFNGEQVVCDIPEFVASNINAYIADTYRQRPTPEPKQIPTKSFDEDN